MKTVKEATIITVMIAGYFDPLHEGHLDHITKAAQLGDYLYIITHTDACTEREKKARYTTLEFREFMLRGILCMLGVIGNIIVTDRADISQIIRNYKPNIFAKGGDREPENMPEAEIKACAEVNCEIVYGIGDLLNSSSAIKAKLEVNHE